MSSYLCKTCNNEFDDPRIDREMLGYMGSAPAYQEYEVCPYCGTEGDFVELYDCMICNESFEFHDMEPGTDLCVDCYDDLNM